MDDNGNENARPGDESGRAQGSPTETKSTRSFEINDAALVDACKPLIVAGFTLVQLEGISKKPLHRDWMTRTYDSTREAAAATRAGNNLGVRLGAFDLVIDVDPRNGGDESMATLAADLDMDASQFPCVMTGADGMHVYLRRPEGFDAVAKLDAYPGIDFKTSGQVVAPGSIHPDTRRRYVGRNLGLLAFEIPAPDALLSLLKRAKRQGGDSDRSGELGPSQLDANLAMLDPEDFGQGKHDDWLTLMQSCHHATNGDGRQEFIEWSTQAAGYGDHGDEIGYRWDSLSVGDGDVTVAFLYKQLHSRGKTPIDRAEPEDDFEVVEMPDAADWREPNDRVLDELNANHFTVLHGGKFLVGREATHPTLGHRIVEWFPDEAIRKFYNTRMIEVPNGNGSRVVPLGKFWTEHPRRRQYGRVVFDPSPHRTETTAYNLWRGWALQPRPGDWSAMKRLVRDVLCAGDADAYAYVMKWAAFMVQQPHVPAETVLVFKGGKGRGKGTFCRELVGFAGQHGRQIANNQHFTGRFNDHLMDCICLFVDEGFWAGDKRAEGVLKNLITERVLTFEAKGMPLVQGPNLLHIVMASNEAWVVPATEDERRFAVFDVSESAFASLPENFFADLVDQMEGGGREGMLHDLLRMDIAGWHPRKGIPKNDARGDQVLRSLRRQEPIVALWFDALSRGEIPISYEAGQTWSRQEYLIEPSQKDALVDEINRHAATMKYATTRDYTKTAVAQFFSRQGFDVKSKTNGLRVWNIPPLGVAREAFEKFVGLAIDWDV